jgi:hypothetical protein
MLKAFNHIIHIVMFSMVAMFGGYDLLDLMLVWVAMMFGWGTTHLGLGLTQTRRSFEIFLLLISIITLYWVAYLSKLGFSTVLSGLYWVVPNLISEDALIGVMPEAFALSILGYVSVIIGVLIFPSRVGLLWEMHDFHPRIILLAVLLPILLAIKYGIKARYNLGVPGLEPEFLGVPYLAGFFTFIIDTGFIFTSSVLLFCGLVLGRPRLMLFGFLLAFTNAVIDLRFGSKDTIVYQLVITAAYLVIAKRSPISQKTDLRKTEKIALISTVIIGLLVVGIYKFLNFYRFALLEGFTEVSIADLSTAIDVALSSDIAESKNSIMEIYNRITGLETFATVYSLSDKLAVDAGLTAMIDGRVVANFTYYILGTDSAKTLFAVTQFGYNYLSGGLAGLIIGCFFLGFTFVLIQFLVMRMRVHNAMKLAFLPLLWVLFIFSLLGGGDMIHWMKEIVATVITFYFTARLACPLRFRRPHPLSEPIRTSSHLAS